jgi:nitrogen fixation-related uncharacterized protein
MSERPAANRLRARLTAIFAVLILTPSMLGFVAKFIEFAHTLQASPDGAFAVTPMLNYLLASLGFLCLLLWALANGMFHDLERPKHRMLEIEQQLDSQAKPHQVFKERPNG